MLSSIARNTSKASRFFSARPFSTPAAANTNVSPQQQGNIYPQEALARKVMKFGGSSVGNAEALYRVAEILKNEKEAGNE